MSLILEIYIYCRDLIIIFAYACAKKHRNHFKLSRLSTLIRMQTKYRKLRYGLHVVKVIDLGEDGQVPEDFSAHEMETGIWWRHLVAGGIAGCT